MRDPADKPHAADPTALHNSTAGDTATRASTAEQLFRDHNGELVRFLRLKLRNDAEAKEVAQEAYVRLLQLRSTGAVGFLRAYLFKIAANLAVDRIRYPRPLLEKWSAGAEGVADPFDIERSVLAAADYALFLKCLDELTPKCREAFVLHRLKKLSTQEVAERLQITPRMVRKHIARALIYCRHRLDGLSAVEAMQRLSHE
jgi:RNA polymerase sigma factor (sigma-70 family)